MSRLRQKEQITPTGDLPNAGEYDFYIKAGGAAAVVDSAGNENIFSSSSVYGTFFNYNVNDVLATTNSTTPQTYVNLTYNNVPDITVNAVYKVSLFFTWGHSAANSSFQGELTLNNIPLGEGFKQEPKDTNATERYGQGYEFFVLGNELLNTGTFSFNFSTENAADTSTLYYAHIELKRCR